VGKVRWAKAADGTNRVQVSPQLIQASSEEAKWQQSFDAPLTDVFQVQADIAGRVASALNIALADSAQRQIAERPTTNLAAYDAFLRGDAISGNLSTSDAVQLHRAAAYYEQATALDPTFTLAWSRMARTYATVYFTGSPSREAGERARRAAESALALAPDRADAHLALGDYYYFVAGDYQRAGAEYNEALRRSPSDASVLTAVALNQQSLGQWDSALVSLRRAAVLDPRSVNTGRRLAFTLLWLRRYEEARDVADRALALAPDNANVLEIRAMVDLAKGDLSAARAVIATSGARIDPTALASFFANYWDLYWVLDEPQQQLLLRLSPTAFDDRSAWSIVLAQT
jgi:tetratricopeptide (TPR) repeat protein